VKKLLVVALSVVMVLAFAAFAMADGKTTLVGNVNAEYNTINNINNGYGDVWAEFDLTKDFTEGWTGGLKFRAQPGKTTTLKVLVLDPITGLPVEKEITYQNGDAVKFEGDGWIKYAADMWNVKFATGGSFGAGADLNAPDADGGQVGGQPNVEANVIPMEGLTLTLFLNEQADATTATGTDCVFNYGFKGVYDLSPLKVGVGYSGLNNGTTADDNVTTMGVFGSYKLMEDALTVGAEYQSRTYPSPLDDPAVGMKVYASYSKDALTAGLSYITRTAMFYTKNDKSAEAWSLADRFMDKSLGLDGTVTNPYADLTSTRYLMSISASYKVTEAITVGAVIDTTDVKYNGVDSTGKALTDVTSGYKVYVTDQIVPDLSLEAGYQSFLDSKVYVKLSAKIN
jgi:hypothetical protein